MSRFSLAEAKGLGWIVTHDNPSGAGGKPKSIAAEKQLTAPGFPNKIVREEAHSMGLLLERVFSYEAHLGRQGYYAARAVAEKVAKRKRDKSKSAS